MTFSDWLDESRDRIKHDGIKKGAYASAQEFWAGALGHFGRHVWNYGESVHDEEWDVLLVLDACRIDLIADVAERTNYDVLEGFDPERHATNSVASRSPEWIAKTFDPETYAEELSNTAYVTANPHSRDVPDPTLLNVFDEVWKYGWDTEYGVVPPRTMTDRAIDVWRESDAEQMIVHYMQPHLPFRSLVDDHPEWFRFEVGLDNPAPSRHKTLWRRLRDREVPHDLVWEAYCDNLEWVLDEMELLSENLEADTVAISSDHGNAMGEWWVYGHQSPIPIPALKRVPWVTFSATDTGAYEPETEAENVDVSDAEYEDRLKNLGYL
ncbi:alkaline phosphatase family protein [Halorussus litoreus]|uniref:hypothetical protein n=1 Tax=Halorussus litoreus TaxID=1710536 RepID=UPI000E282BEC|nr:hypothetical protein [Halorussus litoreus]